MGGVNAPPPILCLRPQTLGRMDELAFWNVPQWGQRRVALATTLNIYLKVSNKL